MQQRGCCVPNPSTSVAVRLTLQALADDAADWREETARYRELALAALERIAHLTHERDRARDQSQSLREELRRYTASQVSR